MSRASGAQVRADAESARAHGSADGYAVTTRALVRDYGKGAGLHGIDLAVPRNRVYGLVGPNGAGKTTLLSILAGLRRADSGQVRVDVGPGRTAVCPDMPQFEPWLTAAEVVGQSRGLAFPGRGRRRGREGTGAGDPDLVGDVLARVGLGDVARRRVGGFSRGMTQRLGLAVALVLDPELVILDEPTSALDPAGRAELLALISGLAGGRTVIFSSHSLADVQRVADHIGVLDRGRLLYQGPMRALIDSHTEPVWEVRVRGSAAGLAERLRGLAWVRSVQVDGSGGVEAGPGAGSDSGSGAESDAGLGSGFGAGAGLDRGLSSGAESDRDVVGSLRVEAVSAEAGEVGLPSALAAAGVRLVSVNPVDADLETAFLALTASHAAEVKSGSGSDVMRGEQRFGGEGI